MDMRTVTRRNIADRRRRRRGGKLKKPAGGLPYPVRRCVRYSSVRIVVGKNVNVVPSGAVARPVRERR